MKKRYLYMFLFGIPGFFFAGITTLLIFGASLGLLWLLVFGDNPWPVSSEKIIAIALVVTFLLLWIGTVILGYVAGKNLEKDSTLNRSHILFSAGITALLILLILLQQWSAGNFEPKSDTALCSDYCRVQEYSGSGMPPRNSGDRTCSCYDASGNEVLRIPLDRIDPSK